MLVWRAAGAPDKVKGAMNTGTAGLVTGELPVKVEFVENVIEAGVMGCSLEVGRWPVTGAAFLRLYKRTPKRTPIKTSTTTPRAPPTAPPTTAALPLPLVEVVPVSAISLDVELVPPLANTSADAIERLIEA